MLDVRLFRNDPDAVRVGLARRALTGASRAALNGCQGSPLNGVPLRRVGFVPTVRGARCSSVGMNPTLRHQLSR